MRGFQRMSPERLREVCSQGGKNATNRHRWTREEAIESSKKGVAARRVKKEASKQQNQFIEPNGRLEGNE